MTDAPEFGPVILFGHGGTAIEVIEDKAMALPPLNMHLAREVMEWTRVFRLLKGYGGNPPADIDGIALTLIKVSQLVCDMAEIAELKINPLLVDHQGVMVLDARIRIVRSRKKPSDRLAVCPYPKELEETVRLPEGRSLLLRPIRPEDEPAFHALFGSLSMEEIRLRFLHYMKVLTHPMAARLTQIDYDRHMALVLTDPPETEGEPELYGVVRIGAEPDNRRAEFAILIRKEMTGMGLGRFLMGRIIDYSRNRGMQEIYGDVLGNNRSMLALCKKLGFKTRPDPFDPGVMRVTLKLE